ncbi:hypothetical protein VX159_06980 [Dechloromonas sp. ZY10]|uniref:hypothetical protein n=1 Tax=Dechloromonas aquae TaxID=2664436 RepID=UPI003528470D
MWQEIDLGPHIHGRLALPETPRDLLLLAHTGFVTVDQAQEAFLLGQGHALLNCALLDEEEIRYPDAGNNIFRLSERLLQALAHLLRQSELKALPLALCTYDATTPAAIRTATQRDRQVTAIAACGGEIDRAGGEALRFLGQPLLLLHAADDKRTPVAHARAARHLRAPCSLVMLAADEAPLLKQAAWFITLTQAPCLSGKKYPPAAQSDQEN